jgi:hypothetical protein
MHDQVSALPPQAHPHHHRPPTSEVLEGLLEEFPNERITVGELLDCLGGRGLGVLLLILALPMCVPNIPGISTIFGFLMLAPALQMMFGQRKLWLPHKTRDYAFPREGLRKAIHAAVPFLKRIEVLIKPRFSFLTGWPVTAYIGFQTLLMALILILPIPGGNWPPGVTVAITALALLQRDGILMLLSLPAAGASVAAFYYFGRFSIFAVEHLFDWGRGLFH